MEEERKGIEEEMRGEKRTENWKKRTEGWEGERRLGERGKIGGKGMRRKGLEEDDRE